MFIIYKSTYFGRKFNVILRLLIISLIFTKIVFKLLRTNLFYIVLLATFLTIGNQSLFGQEIKRKVEAKANAKKLDSVKKSSKVIPIAVIKKDIDTVKVKKATLESTVKRKAADYERIDQKTKIVTLYNKAELYYEDIELKAGIIVMDYAKNEVYAGRIKDKKGNYSQLPVFKQGANVVEPDSIRFNFTTKKALIWNSKTKQGEMNVIANKLKKENDSVYFMSDAKITTAKDLNNPEYYFFARKAKFVPGKKVVVGLTNLYIENVPTPIGLPFAFFPMSQSSQSGVIIPTFQDTNNRGYSLQNGGYYFPLSQYYDLTILGDYYTNGSYALRFDSTYANKYKFAGNVNIRYENQIISERGFPDYTKTNTFNIQWSHVQDTKSNPSSRFSASVNLGSSNYFTNSLNLTNQAAVFNNTLSSSVTYSKTFNSVPEVNMSLSATHSQNTNTKVIAMTLPTFQASVDRVFLFAPADSPKKGIIKNMNFQYTVNAKNDITTTDSLFFKPQMFRDANVGMEHSIPISTNFKILKHLSVTPSLNYREVWTTKTIKKSFDNVKGQEVTETVNGFDAYRTYSFSSGIGTTIYGTFNFGEDKIIKSIRHKMMPSITYSYMPSFERYYENYNSDANGTVKDYSRFERSIYGAPGKNFSNIVQFSVNNTFEAKIADKDTTKTELKKIMLLSNLSFSSSYNLDTKVLDPIIVSGGTLLFKDKMNVNFGAKLDPYAINNATGARSDVWNINNGGSLFRLTAANLAINYSFTSSKEDGKDKKNQSQGQRNGGREDDLFGRSVNLSDDRQGQFDEKDDDKEDKFEGFFKAKLPWDLILAYSLTYSNENRERTITNNSLMVNGNIDLSPRWKVGVSTGYDFVSKGVNNAQLRFDRDLLSWRMSFNWSPIGENSQWGFFIGVKAGIFSDIKWENRKIPDPSRQ